MGKDYYAILGVSKDADEEAIKKAYRKSALKWHPDRNKDKTDVAHAKFQEIGEAYEVLSDKDKRAVFDQYGEEGLKGTPPPSSEGEAHSASFGDFPGTRRTFHFSTSSNGGFRPSNADDIFKHFFSFGDKEGRPDVFSSFGEEGGFGSGFSSFGSMPGNNFRHTSSFKQRQKEPASAISRALFVSLEDLYKGVTKRLNVVRQLRDGSTGKYVQTDKILSITVKPEWKSGTKIRFPGEGDELENGTIQDIEFVLEEKPHPIFKREGDNLRMTMKLTLLEALAGFQKKVKTLDDRTMSVNNTKSIVQSGQESHVTGEGMPNSKTGKKGDLIISYDVKFPTFLTDEQKQQLKSVLP